MSLPLVAQNQPLRVSVHHPGVEHILATHLTALLQDNPGTPTVLCIGTDRSTGDSLGPLVGSFLQEMGASIPIWGTLDHPVHAANLTQIMGEIRERGASPVIAIDACLGAAEQVGTIVAGRGSIRPGAGVRKELPEVGDLHLTGTVNVAGCMEYMVLQNTRLSLVLGMARVMARALSLILPTRRPLPAGVWPGVPLPAQPLEFSRPLL